MISSEKIVSATGIEKNDLKLTEPIPGPLSRIPRAIKATPRTVTAEEMTTGSMPGPIRERVPGL